MAIYDAAERSTASEMYGRNLNFTLANGKTLRANIGTNDQPFVAFGIDEGFDISWNLFNMLYSLALPDCLRKVAAARKEYDDFRADTIRKFLSKLD